ncbi:neprilysin-1-like [Rhipicephalus microplus]|uniref:neprilysin-1-like n=1 Tax=Rhipicephalus microplus TaxID=6941 RepID=UPI003F6CC95E
MVSMTTTVIPVRCRSSSPSVLELGKEEASRATLSSAILLCILVVVAMTVFITRQLASRHGSEEYVCTTEDCILFGSSLLARLNLSADPCSRFYQYVCGNAAFDTDEEKVLRMYSIKVEHFMHQLEKVPRTDTGISHDYELKASRALYMCLDRPQTTDPAPFVQFTREHGMMWPMEPKLPKRASKESGNPVFPILVDLSLNWRVSLWFDVNVINLDHEESFIFTLDDPGPVPVFRMAQLSSLGDDAYDGVMASFLSGGTVTLSKRELTDLRLDEGIVRNTLSFRRDPEGEEADEVDVILPIAEVHVLSRSGGSDQWLAALRNSLQGTLGMTLSNETKILAFNKATINDAFTMLEDLPYEVALNVTGWMFAYVYGWTMGARFDTFFSGHENPETLSSRTLCFLAVHEMHGLAIVAVYMSKLFNASQRADVKAILDSITNALRVVITNTNSITPLTRLRAEAKIADELGISLWPPEPFFSRHTLNEITTAFPAEGPSLFSLWLQTMKVLQESRNNRYYSSLFTRRVHWFTRSVRYLYSQNYLEVGVWALLAPSYRRHGSSLMMFSGLGFEIARSLVRALDSHGRMLDGKGQPDSRWAQKLKRSLYDAKIRREKRALAEVFALNVTLRAFKDSDSATQNYSKLRFLESMSEDQTFFVSLCSHFCGDKERAELCDLVTKTARFRMAFRCEDRTVSGRPCEFL